MNAYSGVVSKKANIIRPQHALIQSGRDERHAHAPDEDAVLTHRCPRENELYSRDDVTDCFYRHGLQHLEDQLAIALAIEDFDALVTLQPENSDAQLQLGQLYFSVWQSSGVEDDRQAALLHLENYSSKEALDETVMEQIELLRDSS